MTKILFVFGLLLSTSLGAQASLTEGGVGSGGGGVIRPHPMTPQDIEQFISDRGGKIIFAWFQGHEWGFERLSMNEKAKSPFAKIYQSSKPIYEILKNTKIELRTQTSCFDANGIPRDGSIYGIEPGSICISPFTVAGQLSQSNFEAGTSALIIHEMSHLLGTTEDEANILQALAFLELSQIVFDEADKKISEYSNQYLGPVHKSYDICYGAVRWGMTTSTMSNLQAAMSNITWTGYMKSLSFIPWKTMRLLQPQGMLAMIMGDYMCSIDTEIPQQQQSDCQKRLDTGFQNDREVNVGLYSWRNLPVSPYPYDKTYDEVVVKRPRNYVDVRTTLEDSLEVFLKEAVRAADDLNAFQLQTY